MIDMLLTTTSIHIMYWILGAILLLLLVWLYNRNKDESSDIDLADLVIDGDTKRISSSKLIRLGTWLITSWGFVFLVSQGTLEEWYAIAYMGIWTGNALFRNYFNKQDKKD